LETGWTRQMAEAIRDHVDGVKRWKQATDKKAIGWLLTDVPEEMIHAAGALPAAVLPGELTLTQADRSLQGFACSYSRSVIEMMDTGKLDYLDGIVIPYICDTTRCLDLVVKHHHKLPYTECLRIPKDITRKGAIRYYRQELERLRNSLAAHLGHYPDAEELRESIALFNRVRGKLRLLRHMLAEKPGTITAADYLLAVRSTMLVPKEGAEKLLDMAVESLASLPASDDPRPRVILAGKVPEPPGIIDMLEKSGLRIIDDLLALGSRYIMTDVDEEKEPMDALAERQFHMLPLSGIWDRHPTRASCLIERAKETKADGVVFLIQKFCEPWEIDYPGMYKELEEQGII